MNLDGLLSRLLKRWNFFRKFCVQLSERIKG